MFRSPNEFVFHAAWLMSGAEPGECGCIYCDTSYDGQTGRNKDLEECRRQVKARIRSFQNVGAKIQRAPNAMNRTAFLKRGASSHRRQVSLEENEEEEEGPEVGASSGEEVGRLVQENEEMEE